MMIGLPASGKSTISKKLQEEGFEWVSSDQIRDKLKNTFKDRSELNYHTFRQMNNTTIDLLKLGKDVVYDATNLNRKDRKKILKEVIKIKDLYDIKIVGYYLNTPYEICVIRNNRREVNKVPDEYMEMYRDKLQLPNLSEGFDVIYLG